jgi:hypothetical protein
MERVLSMYYIQTQNHEINLSSIMLPIDNKKLTGYATPSCPETHLNISTLHIQNVGPPPECEQPAQDN